MTVPVFVAAIQDGAIQRDAGVIHQDMSSARARVVLEMRHCLVNHFIHLLPLRHIRCDGNGIPAFFTDQSGGFLGCLRVNVVDHEVCAM
jgi:hypothetical protein